MKKFSPNTRRHGLLIGVPAMLAAMVVITTLISQPEDHVSAAPPKKVDSQKSTVQFDEQGKLVRPTGYRKWTYVGTPLTPNDMNNGKAPFPGIPQRLYQP